MSYQVLARKWRPKSFAHLVGQPHVVRALENALQDNRLHHAYLFTGTRGVGKTTLARILSKALNCDSGITANPCGTCMACLEIDQGRFIDLVEVDAASATGIENMRELLDNAQYRPVSGRFKIYIIDEVHMLSKNAFNAMLKTLEEPPAHMKFILATTDPHKIPVTVLSRCLQLNLRKITISIISEHLANILTQEGIPFERAALQLIANAATGSMRDALSLTDQAIAHGQQTVTEEAVRFMLGGVDSSCLYDLIQALHQANAPAVIEKAKAMEMRSLSFDEALRDLALVFHNIALAQTVPEALDQEMLHREALLQLASEMHPETVQLYYQISLLARRDLSLAADEFSGFTMALIRMISFVPVSEARTKSDKVPPQITPISEAHLQPTPPPAPTPPVNGFDGDWRHLVEALNLSGMTRELARNSALTAYTENSMTLTLSPAHNSLMNIQQKQKISDALQSYFGRSITLQIQLGATLNTPALLAAQERASVQKTLEASMINETFVQALINDLDAEVLPNSIHTHSGEQA